MKPVRRKEKRLRCLILPLTTWNGTQLKPAFAIDFRTVYATVLDKWWGIDSRDALGGRFAALPFVTA